MGECIRCGDGRVSAITLDDTLELCGHEFTAEVPATRCAACGEMVIQAADVRRFERRVAVELAKAGPRTGESFAFLRKALGADERQLAELLDVPHDFIAFWERREWPMDPRAWAVVSSLVLAKLDGRPHALDCLGILRAPRALALRVRLNLEQRMPAFSPGAQLALA